MTTTQHSGQPRECPTCAPLIAAAKDAAAKSGAAFTMGNFRGYNDRKYLAAKRAARTASDALLAARLEHNKESRS